VGGGGVLALATVAHAAPWVGFAELSEARGQGVRLTARIATKGAVMRGRIVACLGDGPCPFAGARVSFDVDAWDPNAREDVDRLTGAITLDDGTACTFAGDVWDVTVRGKRVARGGLRGQARCPGLGLAAISLWVKGYRPPPGGQ
jgi:hypothetical protein